MNGRVGISFPGYDKDNVKRLTLGNTLRVFASNIDLTNILASLSIASIRDYINLNGIKDVPSGCQYVSFSRVQSRTTSGLKRLMERNNLDEYDAKSQYSRKKNILINDLPYINYYSTSTENYLKIFIKKGEPSNEFKKCGFSSFGLSKEGSTVPHF